MSEYPELRKNIDQGTLEFQPAIYSHSVRFWQDFLLYLHILTLETSDRPIPHDLSDHLQLCQCLRLCQRGYTGGQGGGGDLIEGIRGDNPTDGRGSGEGMARAYNETLKTK